MLRRALVIAVIASSTLGCKADDAKAPPAAPRPAPTTPRPAPAPAAPRPAPAAPTPAPAPVPGKRGHELIDTLLLNEPRFANGAPLASLKVIEEREQATQSWCMSGSDAQTIAAAMASSLGAAGWGDVKVRGAPERAAISGTVDDVSVSITVGGRDATCTGVVATAHYTTSTVIIPPVPDGERLR